MTTRNQQFEAFVSKYLVDKGGFHFDIQSDLTNALDTECAGQILEIRFAVDLHLSLVLRESVEEEEVSKKIQAILNSPSFQGKGCSIEDFQFQYYDQSTQFFGGRFRKPEEEKKQDVFSMEEEF